MLRRRGDCPFWAGRDSGNGPIASVKKGCLSCRVADDEAQAPGEVTGSSKSKKSDVNDAKQGHDKLLG